jgi:hypothetical protein
MTRAFLAFVSARPPCRHCCTSDRTTDCGKDRDPERGTCRVSAHELRDENCCGHGAKYEQCDSRSHVPIVPKDGKGPPSIPIRATAPSCHPADNTPTTAPGPSPKAPPTSPPAAPPTSEHVSGCDSPGRRGWHFPFTTGPRCGTSRDRLRYGLNGVRFVLSCIAPCHKLVLQLGCGVLLLPRSSAAAIPLVLHGSLPRFLRGSWRIRSRLLLPILPIHLHRHIRGRQPMLRRSGLLRPVVRPTPWRRLLRQLAWPLLLLLGLRHRLVPRVRRILERAGPCGIRCVDRVSECVASGRLIPMPSRDVSVAPAGTALVPQTSGRDARYCPRLTDIASHYRSHNHAFQSQISL